MNHVANATLSRNRNTTFVDGIQRKVRVCINNAWHQVQASCVDYGAVCRRFKMIAYRRNETVFNQQVADVRFRAIHQVQRAALQ